MSTSQKSSTLDALHCVIQRCDGIWESQVVDVKMADEFIEQKSHIHDQPQTSLPFKKYLMVYARFQNVIDDKGRAVYSL